MMKRSTPHEIDKADAVIEHPFHTTKTATTSETVHLSAGDADDGSMSHTYTPTGTATVSGMAQYRSDYPGSTVGGSGSMLSFNFDNADIYEVIKTVSEILGFNYVVDPRVTGKVTIITKDKIAQKDLFPVFETLLKLNNATIIKRGDLYQIMPLATSKQEALTPHFMRRKDVPDADEFLIQIVPLNYISADEMVKVLKPFVSPQGADIIPQDTILIILDFAANIKKLMSLIELSMWGCLNGFMSSFMKHNTLMWKILPQNWTRYSKPLNFRQVLHGREVLPLFPLQG